MGWDYTIFSLSRITVGKTGHAPLSFLTDCLSPETTAGIVSHWAKITSKCNIRLYKNEQKQNYVPMCKLSHNFCEELQTWRKWRWFSFCKKWRAEISYVTASCAVLVRWLHFFAFIQKKTKLLSKCQEYFLLMPLASVSCLHLKMVKFWVLLSPFTPQALFRPLGKILQSLLLSSVYRTLPLSYSVLLLLLLLLQFYPRSFSSASFGLLLNLSWEWQTLRQDEMQNTVQPRFRWARLKTVDMFSNIVDIFFGEKYRKLYIFLRYISVSKY